MTPQTYCKQKTSSSHSSFYLSFLFLSKEKREAMMALYAFCREVDDIVDAKMDITVATAKLNWWREEINRLYLGSPQHPVTQALLPAIHRYRLSREHFEEIIDGMSMDLTQNRYQTFKELQLYCYRVASVVGLLSIEIFGYQDRRTLKYAHHLGIALQLTNIIRDIGEDIRRGRLYLPLDEIYASGLEEADFFERKASPKLHAFLESQIERAETFYDMALRELPREDKKSQRVGLIMAATYRTLLREISRGNVNEVLNAKISLPPLRKAWIALRVWLNH
jgi:15-cis-phytoene synthase